MPVRFISQLGNLPNIDDPPDSSFQDSTDPRGLHSPSGSVPHFWALSAFRNRVALLWRARHHLVRRPYIYPRVLILRDIGQSMKLGRLVPPDTAKEMGLGTH